MRSHTAGSCVHEIWPCSKCHTDRQTRKPEEPRTVFCQKYRDVVALPIDFGRPLPRERPETAFESKPSARRPPPDMMLSTHHPVVCPRSCAFVVRMLEVGGRTSREGEELPPAPPVEDTPITRRLIRSQWVIANSWATIPPNETPST